MTELAHDKRERIGSFSPLLMELIAEVLLKVEDLAERHYGLGLLCLLDGRNEAAIQHLQLAKQENLNHCLAFCYLGEIHLKCKQYEEAAEAFEQVLRIGGRGSFTAEGGLYIAYTNLGERGRELLQHSMLHQRGAEETVEMILNRLNS
jgi:tetratricopeptide (TPR) repeat protein